MVDQAQRYAELRQQYPNLSDNWWNLMRERDTARDELADLRTALAHLIGYHKTAGVVPVDRIRDLIEPPEAKLPTMLDELKATAFPPAPAAPEATTHGTTCRPGCCGAGVRQWR